MKNKIGLLGITLLLISACGAPSDEKSRPIVSGYDELGNHQVTEGLLRDQEACPMIGTWFTDLCSDSEGEVVYAKGCGLLCTKNVVDDEN